MKTTVKVWVETKKGNTFEVELPAKRVVCHECNGTGRTLCDGLRGVAFSAEEMHEDPDFAEDYFGGKYDVRCTNCNGANVELVIDEDKVSPKMLERRHRYLQTLNWERQEEAWLRRHGG